MSNLYVIDKERRNSPRDISNANEEHSEKRVSNEATISVERLSLIINTKIEEQHKLWDMLSARDSNKLALMKLSFGVFSVFITGVLAILSFAPDSISLLKSYEFITLFCLAVIGMAMINLALIKNIISLKHSRILFLRQINCLRHSVDSCHFALVYGRFPRNKEELMSCDSAFFIAIEKHRKLPIDNDQFRSFHKRVFESSDNYTIGVVAVLTIILGLIPPAYLLTTGNSNIIGIIAALCVVVYVGVILRVNRSSKEALDYALEFNKFDECE